MFDCFNVRLRAGVLGALAALASSSSCACGGPDEASFIAVRSQLLATAPSPDADCNEDVQLVSGVVDLERATRYVARFALDVPKPFGEYGGPLQNFTVGSITLAVSDPNRSLQTALGDAPFPIPGTPSQDEPRVIPADEIELATTHGIPHVTFTALTSTDLAAIGAHFGGAVDEGQVSVSARVEGTLGFGIPARTSAYSIEVGVCRGCLAAEPPCEPEEQERTPPCAFQGQDVMAECVVP